MKASLCSHYFCTSLLMYYFTGLSFSYIYFLLFVLHNCMQRLPPGEYPPTFTSLVSEELSGGGGGVLVPDGKSHLQMLFHLTEIVEQ